MLPKHLPDRALDAVSTHGAGDALRDGNAKTGNAVLACERANDEMLRGQTAAIALSPNELRPFAKAMLRSENLGGPITRGQSRYFL
jgi:hypothetical protein